MGARSILVLQHEADGGLGTLEGFLRARGLAPEAADFGLRPDIRPRLTGRSGLIILGGAMNANDERRHPHLGWEMELIREAAARRLPVLGICLGAQLAAKALGGRVIRAPKPEIGWYGLRLSPDGRRDPLFRGWEPGARVLQWHEDAFEPPPGAVRLACSRFSPEQAFRWGGRVYGVQFHLEGDANTIAAWFGYPRPGIDCAQARRAAGVCLGPLARLAEGAVKTLAGLIH